MVAAEDPDSGEVVYGRMRWNTPLSEAHASLLLERLEIGPGCDLVDLGCGWGELLLRGAAAAAVVEGIGVDSDEWARQRGQQAAARRGLSDRVTFVAGDIAEWTRPADRVLCVGASHAWGGSAEALTALWDLVRPDGRLLIGDGCWERPPGDAAAAIFGGEVLPLADLVRAAITVGWRVMHLSTADQREWDDFEGAWRAGRQDWLLANPDHARASQVRQKLDEQLREYVESYRGVLGFAYLVLAR